MSKLSLAFVAAVSLFGFGCSKGKGAAGEALAKMEDFQKRMCECKDKGCAEKVQADMTSYMTEMAKTAKPDDKPDPEMQKKFTDVSTKLGDCMAKVMTAAAPPPPDTKPADTKPADTKPADDKPADTKADTKPDDKKADDKKADDKKADDKKHDDKKPDDKGGGGW